MLKKIKKVKFSLFFVVCFFCGEKIIFLFVKQDVVKVFYFYIITIC